MKVRIAALVLTGILCATAPAWSDTISGHARDSAVDATRNSGQFDLCNAQTLTFLLSSFADSSKFELIGPQPEYRLWERWDWRGRDSGGPPSTTTPVAASEPSTFQLLLLGFVGLLGAAWLDPSRRVRTL